LSFKNYTLFTQTLPVTVAMSYLNSLFKNGNGISSIPYGKTMNTKLLKKGFLKEYKQESNSQHGILCYLYRNEKAISFGELLIVFQSTFRTCFYFLRRKTDTPVTIFVSYLTA